MRFGLDKKEHSGEYVALYNGLLICTGVLVTLLCGCAVWSMWFRVPYPFELDWIEGEIMCHVVRLLEGKSIYPMPSMEFVAEMYPPLYYYTTALCAKLIGIGMPAGRTVSVAACLVLIVMLYRVGMRETGSRHLAFISAGLFFGLYHVHGPWYDLARVDMLFFLFLFGGCFLLAYYAHNAWGTAAAVGVMVLACYTKQNGLVYLGFMALYLVIRNTKQGVLFACGSAAVICAIFMVGNAATDGWFGKYTFYNLVGYKNNIAGSMPSVYQRVIEDIQTKLPMEMRYELLYKLPILCTMLFAYFAGSFLLRRNLKNISLWEYMAIAGVLTYFLVRPHPGSEKNDLMHLTLWACILIVAGIRVLGNIPQYHIACAAQCTALILLCLQLVLLWYDPRRNIPSPGSREAGEKFIETVKNIDGEVFIPYHSFYGYMAGKSMLFNAGAFWGFQLLSPGTYDPHDMIERINRRFFAAIIIDETSYYSWLGQRVPFDNIGLLLKSGEPLAASIERNYRLEARFPYRHPDEFRNPTGFMTRPEIILVPKS